MMKYKFKLFMIDGPELTEEIVMTVKLLTLLATVCWLCLAYVIGDLVGHSIFDSLTTSGESVIFFTVIFFTTVLITCILELVLQPYLRNETPLKTPFHYIAIGVVILVTAMVLRGFYLHGREIENISQPRLLDYCQLRFFNSLADEVLLKVENHIDVKVKPYGAAYFLKIPAPATIRVEITTKQGSFNSDLHVNELFSYSYIIHSDIITEELVQNPLIDNWQLTSDTAYFFLLDSKLANVLTLYKDGKATETISMATRRLLYAIPPGYYTVHIKANNSETTTAPKMLLPGHVYCLFIHSLQNDTSAIEGKFIFNTLKKDENYIALGIQGVLFSVGQMTMFVTILFFVQTESSISCKGTVFTWTTILFHLANKLIYVKKLVFKEVTSMTHYSTAFFVAVFIVAAMNSALR